MGSILLPVLFLFHQILFPFKMSREINIKCVVNILLFMGISFGREITTTTTKNHLQFSTGLHTSSTIRRSSTYRYFNVHLKEIASCVLTLWVGILMTISAWRSTVVASTINRKGHLFFEKYKLFSHILNDIFVFFYRNIPNFMHIL